MLNTRNLVELSRTAFSTVQPELTTAPPGSTGGNVGAAYVIIYAFDLHCITVQYLPTARRVRARGYLCRSSANGTFPTSADGVEYVRCHQTNERDQTCFPAGTRAQRNE